MYCLCTVSDSNSSAFPSCPSRGACSVVDHDYCLVYARLQLRSTYKNTRRVFNLTSSTKGHSSTTSTEFQNASNINVSSTRKRQSLLCFCPDAKKMDDDEIHEHTGTQAGLRRPLPQRRKRHYRPSCMHETLKTAAGVAGNILGVCRLVNAGKN